MQFAAMIEKGKTSWQAAQTRMTSLPPELRRGLILAISALLIALALMLAMRVWRSASVTRSRPGSGRWNGRSSIACMPATGESTNRTTPKPAQTIDYDPDYMIQDGGEVFWNLAAMYRERNTLYDVNMALNELELRVATMEKKRDATG